MTRMLTSDEIRGFALPGRRLPFSGKWVYECGPVDELLDLLADQVEALAPAVRHYLECGKTKKTD